MELLRKKTPRWIILILDLLISVFSLTVSYIVRFDVINIPFEKEINVFFQALPIFIIIKIFISLIFKIPNGLVRYTSLEDTKRILISSLTCSIVFFIVSIIKYYFVDKEVFLPSGIIIIEFFISFFIMILCRFLVKIMYHESIKSKEFNENIIIYGTGISSLITKKTLESDTTKNINVIGFINDNYSLKGKRIDGITVYHPKKIDTIIREANTLVILNEKPNIVTKRKLVDKAIQNNLQILEVPSVDKWINGELSSNQLKKFKIDNLLGRKPIKLEDEILKKQLDNKRVLVSGGAGSIGSGIIKELIKFDIAQIIIVDQAESPMYNLLIELKSYDTNIEIHEVIGDIRNLERMDNIFNTFKPQIVFHAAAYKHVPLMEDNPTEAILTNVKGSKNLVDLSHQYGIEKFVLVSTDKAVNPTNVMGASKRIAEIYAQSKGINSTTKFVTTRFGNVLGSNGSVIPLFKKQIENGGPLTVTDERITRYFMTIPEACRLVLEAGVIGKGGEIYVFDMGEPVRIIDLAKKMIYLSGLEIGKDIDIKITGLRPGEKLYEELLNDKESTQPTHHPQILIAKGNCNTNLKSKIIELIELFEIQNNDSVVQKMKEIVPEFKSNNSIFSKFD